MAGETYATGAAQPADTLRQRNVQQVESNGQLRYAATEVDVKKSQAIKKVSQHIEYHVDVRLTHLYLKEKSFVAYLDEYEPYIAPVIFIALAFFTRMWKIGLSPIVTWDEAQYVISIILHLAAMQQLLSERLLTAFVIVSASLDRTT